MALVQNTYDDEFFVRFTKTGIQGMHIAGVEEITDDATGELKSSKRTDPRPVTSADSTLIASVSSAINAASLAQVDALNTQITTLTADKTAAETARDAALAQVAALQAQITELQPPAVNGVPQEVTMRQAQLALLATKLADGSSLLDHVDAAIASMPGDAGRAAQITWSKSADVMRTNALIAQLQGALGLTDADVDALFVAAAKL